MFRCFFPDEYLDSAYVIDYDRLYREGYRGLIYDIDNTLVPHGAPADERAIALFAHLREPAVVIRRDSVTFNTACIAGLERTWIWLLSVVKQSD